MNDRRDPEELLLPAAAANVYAWARLAKGAGLSPLAGAAVAGLLMAIASDGNAHPLVRLGLLPGDVVASLLVSRPPNKLEEPPGAPPWAGSP
jgi:uncharacterized RDD family membrane protein YckC